MRKLPKKRVSPYEKYHIILEEKDHKFVAFSKKHNCMLLGLVAPIFLPSAAADMPDSIAISREETMGMTHIVDSVEKEFGLPRTLYFLIETIGGSGAAAYNMARLLRSKFKKIVVFVPHFALSAGTVLACMSDEIVMDVTSHLGPFDAYLEIPDLGLVSGSALRKGIEIAEEYYRGRGDKDPEKRVRDRVDPAIQGLLEDAQKAGELYLTEVLTLAKYSKRKVKSIVKKLVWDYPTHEYPITIEEAKELGLRVSPRSKYPELWGLMEEWLDKLAFHPKNADHLIAFAHPGMA
ncbi:hypothetical protein AMJ40_00500 [candidate division TA06 bacterium DG_26]|uniref:Serine dehydrogenase proteinase n=1 Tax=candidate division TA06 bacterium DG_26 TaxID=1703771 RepID=A0A0S7WM20_UNCT6|nr:MAG: hypothetical protein AMJ40_00500 [candidate division TA06 bacterium DG_26]